LYISNSGGGLAAGLVHFIAFWSQISHIKMREIVHIQAGQCGNQIGAKVCISAFIFVDRWHS